MQSVCNISNCFSKKRTAYFVYDIEGYVSSVLIDVPHDSILRQRYKKVDYYYDLVSDKINEMIYQNDSIDEFIHTYEYDADNRVTDVMTSRDSLYWEHDAGYEYYDHGPLAREVIGRRQVAGVDYAYTVNGWLKGVNSSVNNPSYDMGLDGDVHSINNTVARDAFGYTLNYYNGDYRSIGMSNFAAAGLPITSLYNGNIAGATYSIKPLTPKTIGYTYGYDQLARVVLEKAFKGIDTINNLWLASDSINDLREKVSYDENGNVLTYLRHGNTSVGPLAMDSLNYYYNKGKNQLNYITDAVPSTNYANDLHNERKNNYEYNGIGERARDSLAGIDTITWTIYGKIREIKKYNGDSIVFFYNALNNLLEKRYYPHSGITDTTKYIKDAQGKVLAVYDRKRDTIRLTELEIYGSKRIGSLDTLMRMQKPAAGMGSIDSLTVSYLEGQKQYELDNHLENVLVTISDKKIPVDTITTDTLAKYYLPLVINAQDYYPYGMEQPGRTYLLVGDSAFKFGYNSKLKVNEVYGIANLYDYGSRMYDPRIGPGGFLSIDPIADSFPMLSPYQYASDNPIWNLDIDGLEGAHTTKRRDKPIVNNDFSGGGWPELFGGTRAKYVKLTKLPESDTHIKQRMSHYEHKKYHYVRDVENIDNPLTPRSRTVKERNESGITDFTPKYPTGTFSVDVEPISNGGQPGKITIGIVGPDGKQRDVQTVIQNGQTQHLEIKKFRLKPGERIFVQEETGKTGTVDKIKATHREVSKKRVLDQ